jgi:hypothetical protein
VTNTLAYYYTKIITPVKVFYSVNPNGICLVRGTLNIKGKGIEVPITFAIRHSAQACAMIVTD